MNFEGLPEGVKEYSVVRTDKYYTHTLDDEGILEGDILEVGMIKNSTLLITVNL